MTEALQRKPGEIEACAGLDSEGCIVAAAWLFLPNGKRAFTDKQALRFCSEADTIVEVKFLTADQMRNLFDTKGWAETHAAPASEGETA